MSDHDAPVSKEPVSQELDPDEPHTPWWMPLLGGFLFLLAGLIAVIVSGSDSDADGAAGEAPTEGAAAELPPAGQDHAGHDHD